MSICTKIPLETSMPVREAFAAHKPVVALESTVITHGLPYPGNIETLCMLEQCVRDAGAEPATIIVWDGIARVGIGQDVLESLSQPEHPNLHKLGERDLAMAFARRYSGGTTVSATMRIAACAGIDVFATGGIGGVHRGWQSHWDISSDLTALSSIPVIVVSAGCKAILDIPATLEMLETLAVPVLGWQTDEFPAFYSRQSGMKIDRVDDLDAAAEFWKCHLGLHPHPGGVLLANPIPPQDEIPSAAIEPFIQSALAEAAARGICGKALTPFLLDNLSRATKGESVRANLALLRNNARLASELAIALKG